MNIENNGIQNNRSGAIGDMHRNNSGARCNDSDFSRSNNRGANGGRDYNTNSGELLKKIQELCFAKTETGLYLNAYPECVAALEYYKLVCEELEKLVVEYENTQGPLTMGGVNAEEWTWTKGIWPWQLEKTEER